MAVAATPPTGVSNGELVRWTFEMINARDVSALRQMWTDATSERFPSGIAATAPRRSARYFDALFAALPDLHMQVVALAENGERRLRALAHDRHAQRRRRSRASSRPAAPWRSTGWTTSCIRDGTVATNFVVFDQMQFARQIGMLPPDGSAADRGTKAAFNAKSRLLARLRGGRRRR